MCLFHLVINIDIENTPTERVAVLPTKSVKNSSEHFRGTARNSREKELRFNAPLLEKRAHRRGESLNVICPARKIA